MAQVLSAQPKHDGQGFFSADPLLQTSPPQPSLFSNTSPFSSSPSQSPSPQDINTAEDTPSSWTPSSISSTSPTVSRVQSFRSTPPSSISLDAQHFDDDDDEDAIFPSYDSDYSNGKAPTVFPSEIPEYDQTSSISQTPDTVSSITGDSDISSPFAGVVDDTAVKEEPSSQVDYLSHDWREEDIWSSWKHIVSQRRVYGEQSRLENASWRTWAKQKNHLKTISPETLNWLKDCDVTWLYGPLQHAHGLCHASEPSSRLSKCNSFLGKKPILKKRSVSEVMLQKSISSSSLVKQAAAAVQAQRRSNSGSSPVIRNRLKRSASDFIVATNVPLQPLGTAESTSNFPSSVASGLMSPDPSGGRHIRFDTKVEQCIAVDFKGGGREDESSSSWTRPQSEDSSEDEFPTIKVSARRRSSRTSSSRSSFSGESKGIAKLPSTTLKSHNEEVIEQNYFSNQFASHSARIMSSPSQETLRPPKISSNNIPEDGQGFEDDLSWEPAGAFGNLQHDNISDSDRQLTSVSTSFDNGSEPSAGLRRTPSGMFMPFDEDDDNNNLVQTGIIGRVVDTVNTAKDIAHVIWNVGWRK